MISVDANRSIGSQSYHFVKNNFTDLFRLNLKYSIFVFIVSTVLKIIQEYTANMPYVFFTFACLAFLLQCCATLSFSILVTRNIVYDENLTKPFLKNLYSRTTFKLFAASLIYISGSAVLIALPIGVKKFISNGFGNGLIVVSVIALIYFIIRIITLNIDIIANNKIRFGFNMRLTKGNFFKSFGCLLLMMSPFIIACIIILILVSITILLVGKISNIVEVSQIYENVIITNPILYSLLGFIVNVILMYISAFNCAVMTNLYIKLMRQSGIVIKSTQTSQPELIQV